MTVCRPTTTTTTTTTQTLRPRPSGPYPRAQTLRPRPSGLDLYFTRHRPFGATALLSLKMVQKVSRVRVPLTLDDRFGLLHLHTFLDASTHLYKRVCLSVGPSVGLSVSRFFQITEIDKSNRIPKIRQISLCNSILVPYFRRIFFSNEQVCF